MADPAAAPAAAKPSARSNQKRRTRKDLLDAAARLMREGRRLSLDEIAEAALVSRATAYRYFQGVDALLLEASLDIAAPTEAELFPPGSSRDPMVRLERLDARLDSMIRANEPALRTMLINSLARTLDGGTKGGLPARQNRRTPLIEAALEPAGDRFDPHTLDMLAKALALVIGTEAMIVCKDVLQIEEAAARKVRRWAIRGLVGAAEAIQREGGARRA